MGVAGLSNRAAKRILDARIKGAVPIDRQAIIHLNWVALLEFLRAWEPQGE